MLNYLENHDNLSPEAKVNLQRIYRLIETEEKEAKRNKSDGKAREFCYLIWSMNGHQEYAESYKKLIGTQTFEECVKPLIDKGIVEGIKIKFYSSTEAKNHNEIDSQTVRFRDKPKSNLGSTEHQNFSSNPQVDIELIRRQEHLNYQILLKENLISDLRDKVKVKDSRIQYLKDKIGELREKLKEKGEDVRIHKRLVSKTKRKLKESEEAKPTQSDQVFGIIKEVIPHVAPQLGQIGKGYLEQKLGLAGGAETPVTQPPVQPLQQVEVGGSWEDDDEEENEMTPEQEEKWNELVGYAEDFIQYDEPTFEALIDILGEIQTNPKIISTLRDCLR